MGSLIFSTIAGSAVVLSFLGVFLAGNRAQDINHIQIRRRWPNAKRRLIESELAKNWKYKAGPRIAFCCSPFVVGGFFSKFQGWEAASTTALVIALIFVLSGVGIRFWGSIEVFAKPAEGTDEKG